MSSGNRITKTWFGYGIIAIFFILYSLLLTSSTSGEWFSYFLPSIAGASGLVLFCIAVVSRTKIPQLPIISWITIIIAGGYFFSRAWFSPNFYGSLEDLLPMAFALIFYIVGIFVGFSRSSNRVLFSAVLIFVVANTILLNDVALFNKDIVLGRPTQSLLLYPVGSSGTFGYENFTSQFLIGTSFFCIAYFIYAGFKSWQWLLIGLVGCFSALQITGARSCIPNIILGSIICWALVLIRSQAKSRLFVLLSIISILGVLGSIVWFMTIITQRSETLAELASLSNSSARFLIFSVVPKIVESAPLIGHGAQAFPHLALPLMPYCIMPNMAHNEYAQAISDYGWIGLSLMVALLGVHLFLGWRVILQKTIIPERKAIYAAAFTLMPIMCFHAIFDFIWHNAALASSAGLCLGVLSTARINQPKSGSKINNYSLFSLSVILCVGLFAFSKLSYPIWNLSWEMDKLPKIKKGEIRTEHLDTLNKSVSISGDPRQTDKLAHIILNSPELSTPANCKQLIQQLEHSVRLSPQNDMLKTDLGRAYDKIGEFEKSEALLYPYSYPPYYNAYPWKAIYLKHLNLWASSYFGIDNAKAFSILIEADRMYPIQRSFGQKSKKGHGLLKDLLLRKGVTPDNSWKKSRNP